MSEATEMMVGRSADIVSAYVSNNVVTKAELPKLIGDVFAALNKLQTAPEAPPAAPPVPAVPIRKSVTPEAIICLEDGKPYKSLRRHLSVAYGMSPEQYRKKWGLPTDYPMVAPAYAEARSALAKALGLGRKPGESAPPKTKRTKGMTKPKG